MLAACFCAGFPSDQFMFQFVGAVTQNFVSYIEESTALWEYKELTRCIVPKYYTGLLREAQITHRVSCLVRMCFSDYVVFDHIIYINIYQ